MPFHERVPRAAGTFEDIRTGPHLFLGITGGNLGYMDKYMLIQTGKVRNYQKADQGNQGQLTYVLDLCTKFPFLGP